MGLERADKPESTVILERNERKYRGCPETSRDLRAAAKLMGVREARYFVDTYYDLQDYRIAAANQQRKLLEGQEPSEFIAWLKNGQLVVLEGQSKPCSTSGARGATDGRVEPCGCRDRPSHFIRIDCQYRHYKSADRRAHLAVRPGLDPTCKWRRAKKRPWNASLKRLCWLMGESFVKVSGNPQ